MKGDKDIKFEQPSEALLLVNKYIMIIVGVIILGVLAVGYFTLLQPKINDIKSVEQTTEEEESRKLSNEKLLRRIEQLADEYEIIKDERQVDLENLKKILPDNPQIAEMFVMSDRLATERGFDLTAITISENIANEPVNVQATVTGEAGDDLDAGYEKTTEEKALEEMVDVYGSLKSMTIHLSLVLSDKFQQTKDGEWVEVSPYDAFKEYLSDLENNLRLIDIKSVTFGALIEPGNRNNEDDQGNQQGVEEENPEEEVGFSLDIITYYR